MNKISVGKQHKPVSKEDNPFNIASGGYAIFYINTKVATGILHTGIGETHVNNLLSALNIPQINHKSLKQREVEIGTIIQAYADKSVDIALKKEQELTKKELNITGNVRIEVSLDAAWQKRGTQKSYNSLSGIASAISKRTKKIVHYNA